MARKHKPVDDLWLKFSQTRDPATKKQLVEIYYPFVKKIAIGLAERLNYKVPVDELTSSGVDGLYRAIDRFQLGIGVKFESYSQQRIRGSMVDWLRKEDIIPRSVRMNNNSFEKTRQKMQAKRGRKVSDTEVAENLGVKAEFIRNRKKFQPLVFSSLDSPTASNDDEESIKYDVNINLIDRRASSPASKLKRMEFFNKLMSRGFTKTERLIVYLYYYKTLTMDRVAERINLSESRVSQMHKKIIPRLLDKIKRNPEYFSVDVSNFVHTARPKDEIL
tara:strand:+ start:394 stop:1221 length:828 start_codon:yes stop_codon:yes gene_type:complete